MRLSLFAAAPTACLLTTACLAVDDDKENASEAAACFASNLRDGTAWIDKMPGPNDNPTLHVSLTVDAPNQGDVYTLEFEYAEEKAPPNYVFGLKRIEEGGPRVITETPVKYQWAKFPEPSLSAIIILCGAETLEISPVEETS